MRTNIWITSALLLTLVGSGCARWRGMNRNQYAQMSDPFVQTTDAVAQAAPGATSAGVVRLGADTARPQTAQTAQVSGSSRGTTAAADSRIGDQELPRTAALGRPRAAEPPRPQKSSGPSLSDFMNDEPTVKTQTARPGSAIPKQRSSTFATVTEDLDEFGKYLDSQVAAAEKKPRETALPTDADLAEWASEWQDDQPSADGGVAQVKHAFESGTSRTDRKVVQAGHEVQPPRPGSGSAAEVATPLITNPPAAAAAPPAAAAVRTTPANSFTAAPPAAPASSPAAAATPPASAQPDPIADFLAFAEANKAAAASTSSNSKPATNPADGKSAAAAEGSSSKSANATTLDATFNFDSGWRPSHLTRP